MVVRTEGLDRRSEQLRIAAQRVDRLAAIRDIGSDIDWFYALGHRPLSFMRRDGSPRKIAGCPILSCLTPLFFAALLAVRRVTAMVWRSRSLAASPRCTASPR
jgi:hypothetical protein